MSHCLMETEISFIFCNALALPIKKPLRNTLITNLSADSFIFAFQFEPITLLMTFCRFITMAFNLKNDMYHNTVIHHDKDGHKKAIIALSFGMKGQLLGKTMASDCSWLFLGGVFQTQRAVPNIIGIFKRQIHSHYGHQKGFTSLHPILQALHVLDSIT